MSEYIGSRISLISKSDIKYIGTLHEINSENHTVALESVTSYGTEGRKGNLTEEIPGSDQVYEYIVFRGSDVKELTIVAAPGEREKEKPKVPDDPAILGSARPLPPQQQPPNQNQFRGPPPYPQQHPHFNYPGPPPPHQFQNQPRFQGPGGPHGFPGSPGAVPGYGFPPPPPPGYGMGFNGPPPPGHGFPPHPPPGHGPPHQPYPSPPGPQMNQQLPPQQMPGQHQPPIGSKHGTPQPPLNQGPPQPPPQQQGVKPVEMSATPGPASESPLGPPPPPPVESKPSVAAATAPSTVTQQPQQLPPAAQKPANNRVAVPLAPKQRSAPTAQPPVTQQAQPQSFADATQAATAAVAAAMAKLGTGKPQTDGATDNLTQKVNQMRIQDQQQRGRGTRGRAGPPRGGTRSKAIEVPKEDYDFESANAKFNKQELVKEAIASGSPNPLGSPTANGDSDSLAATAGAVNGHANIDGEKEGDESVVIPPAERGYDKQSSFFDNISSDLKDRTEQVQDGSGVTFDGRAMRTQERSKNMETFGQSNVDGGGYRGGYRGRGRGYGYNPNYRGRGYRGRGGYERGGYRGRGRGGAEGETAAPIAS